jgi:alkanesulfonate monooxygenase SsuD/methylene tetrahydromethanopterin reductase-like flavin-dependent oxidoreductase (luciferase family)
MPASSRPRGITRDPARAESSILNHPSLEPDVEFGINFFPCLSPAQRSAEQHFREVLHLASLCDGLGYAHVREVEHYFEPYGGYSPNPIVLLSALSQVTRKARLVTGAVLPAFNNPLKLAGEIGMLDAISGGRLDVGFARAFLPHEFERFGVSLDESRRRFTEGVEQVRLLLEQENVSHQGEFHGFRNVTSLPRPTQQPRPPLWTAALSTPQSFEEAGRNGYGVMAIPLDAKRMFELFGIYREAWRSAGHPGKGRIMNSFLMCCAPTRQEAIETARDPVNGHLQGLVESASGWLEGASTKDYPGYDKMIAQLREEDFDQQLRKGLAWVGSPDDIAAVMMDYHKRVGGFEIASLLVTPSTMPVAAAERSMRVFAEHVMPKVAELAEAA